MLTNSDYEAVLADLEQRKIELVNGIAAIRRIVARFDTVPVPLSGETNITAATLRFLSDRPFESFRAREIAAGIGCAKVGSVRGAIFRHLRRGVLRKDQDGRVCFVGGATEKNRDV